MILTRTQIRDALYDIVAAYAAANPGTLRQVYKARPGSFPETPLAFIGSIVTTWTHTGQLRQTVPTSAADIVFVSKITDNVEAKVALDLAADSIANEISADPHVIGANTSAAPIGSIEEAIEVGAVVYTAITLTVGDITIVEGVTT